MDAEIRLRGNRFDFSLPLGSEPASPQGGGAAWEEVGRPQRDALTDYQGDDLIKLSVPVLLNGWRRGHDVGPKVRQVISICRGEDGNAPPDFTAEGPFPFSGMRFVMEGLPEWGEQLRGPEGTLLRQALILKLIQFNDPNVIRFRRKRQIGVSPAIAVGPITLHQDETLIEVAAKYLRDSSRATEIGKLNGIRDIRKKQPAGKRIKLPDSA